MLRLNERQRTGIADKLTEMANLVAAAIMVGFAIGEPAATVRLFIGVMATWIAVLLVAVFLWRVK